MGFSDSGLSASAQRLGRALAGAIGRDSWPIRVLRPAYESALSLVSGGRGIAWEINSVGFRIDPRQRRRLAHEYDAPVADFLRQRVKPGAVCFDVGANVGVYVLQFAHWTGPSGKVVAFEPNPAAVEVLSAHVRLNGFEDRVDFEPIAIGATSGVVTLYRIGVDGMSRLGEPNQRLKATEPIKVPQITIDDYCRHNALEPDWILIDIEGFEFAALGGAVETLNRTRGRLGLVVEMHPSVWASAKTTRAQAEEFLELMSLDAVPLGGQSDALGEHGLVHLRWR
ncbi:MAG TPA: FkbM family methyltransferase [Candidatus Binataceae bacterium]|nr:FkbM family methyltransferase [Candidatus Binataceae bacterium]